MNLDPKNILLTGHPRCGKSTLVEKLVARIERPMTGFFTREIREGGERAGFAITGLDGREGLLAHRESRSRIRVGKYGVNLDILDQIAVPSMTPSKADQIIIIDEIGKMECFSPLFRQTLVKALDSPNPVIGSIALQGTPFIEDLKKRADILLVEVDERNRDSLVPFLLERIPSP
jgi:nucleoside-triphosphatase THEP1